MSGHDLNEYLNLHPPVNGAPDWSLNPVIVAALIAGIGFISGLAGVIALWGAWRHATTCLIVHIISMYLLFSLLGIIVFRGEWFLGDSVRYLLDLPAATVFQLVFRSGVSLSLAWLLLLMSLGSGAIKGRGHDSI